MRVTYDVWITCVELVASQYQPYFNTSSNFNQTMFSPEAFAIAQVVYVLLNILGHGFLAYRSHVPRGSSRLILAAMVLAMGVSGCSFIYYNNSSRAIWDSGNGGNLETFMAVVSRIEYLGQVTETSFYAWQTATSVACSALIVRNESSPQHGSGRTGETETNRRKKHVESAPFSSGSAVFFSVFVFHWLK
ncbi:hypothetical protein PM082_009503 [Marasmius tenuissimus]|nr:hypothetical protein PM082_009503 [Marasmius tenuissimus]